MVSEASMSSNQWSIVSELFVPRNYEEYCNFMESHMIELDDSFLIPWPMEGGFEYWIHDVEIVDSLTNNVSFVSVGVQETSIYEETDAAKEESDQSMDQELHVSTCECLDSSRLLIVSHRDELDDKPLKLTDSTSHCRFDSTSFSKFSDSVLYIYRSTNKDENQRVCVNNPMSKKIEEMFGALNLFDKMTEKKPPFSMYVFDPGISLLMFLGTGGKDVTKRDEKSEKQETELIGVERMKERFSKLLLRGDMSRGIHLENLDEIDVYREDDEHINPKEISNLEFEDTRLIFYSILEPWNAKDWESWQACLYESSVFIKTHRILVGLATPVMEISESQVDFGWLPVSLQSLYNPWIYGRIEDYGINYSIGIPFSIQSVLLCHWLLLLCEFNVDSRENNFPQSVYVVWKLNMWNTYENIRSFMGCYIAASGGEFLITCVV